MFIWETPSGRWIRTGVTETENGVVGAAKKGKDSGVKKWQGMRLGRTMPCRVRRMK